MVAGTTPDGKVRHGISFGGISTLNYDCICNGSESFGAPERDVEKIAIPGKNGELTFDNGRFKDAPVKYSLFFAKITECEEFKMKVLSLKGAQRFEDSHHPNEYRYASISGTLEPSVGGYLNAYCSLEITFTMFPQRYLVSGESEITVSNRTRTIVNPTRFESKPLVKVYGYGNVNIGGRVIYVEESDYNYIIIDCEMGDAYYSDRSNGNGAIMLGTNEFWTIPAGSSMIVLASTVTKIELEPRWWTI